MKNSGRQNMQYGIGAFIVLSLALFFVYSFPVLAQQFVNPIEPSGQAPTQNVLDFISQDDTTQARFGKLRVGAPISQIPDTNASMLTVDGNVVIQGNLRLDAELASKPSWYVNTVNLPTFVTSGTVATNGKFTVSSVDTGIYASATQGHAVIGDVNAAGIISDPLSVIFGQTTSTAEAFSAGVWGKATMANGYGVYGEHFGCIDGNPATDCGYAGLFRGNVIVVDGVIRGDGRRVFKGWSISDAANAGKNISTKTFDVSPAELASNEFVKPDALAEGDEFVSMNVLVDGQMYNPSWGDPASNQYVGFEYQENTRALTIKKASARTISDKITVQIFYSQKIDLVIKRNDQAIVTDYARPSGLAHTYVASIGGDQYAGGDFTWGLTYNGGSACDSACGTIVANGDNATFTPPASMPALASGKRTLTLTARWTTDPSHVFASVGIMLYDIKIQNKPAGDVLIIGGPSHPFGTNVLAQTPTSDSLPANSANMAFTITQGGSFGTFPTFGTYQPAATIQSDPPYAVTIRLQYTDSVIPNGADDFYDTYSFTLLPQVRIIAENTTDGKSWTAQGVNYGNAEVAVSQQLRLTAEAIGVPASVSHSFQWAIANGAPALLDSLTDPDPSDIYMTYTAAPTVNTSLLNERQRRISATWNSDARSQQYLYIYPGNAVAKTIAINKGTSTSFTLPVNGFFQERTLQRFMQPANGNIFNFTRLPNGNIDFGSLAYVTIGNTVVTCGELRYTGPVNSGSCDPATAQCIVNAGFTYIASATACGPITVRVYPYADMRYFVNVSLQSKEVIPCNCSGCNVPPKYTPCDSCCGAHGGSSSGV